MWFSTGFNISCVFLKLIFEKEKNSYFPYCCAEMDGNQSRSHQMKSNEATSLFGKIASECKMVHGTCA